MKVFVETILQLEKCQEYFIIIFKIDILYFLIYHFSF